MCMSRKKPKQTPKRVLRLPDLDFAKSAVLNTLRSSESKRSYRFAIDDLVCVVLFRAATGLQQDRRSSIPPGTGVTSLFFLYD
jgi:hypothetical protein